MNDIEIGIARVPGSRTWEDWYERESGTLG